MPRPIKLYDTMTRQVREVLPLKDEEFRIYACGPTVYDYPHIGNLRAFIAVDLLHRTLKHFGWKVRLIMNLTDVDDKTIKGSRREGIPLKDYTTKYAEIFFSDLKALNILPATHYPRATDHIPQMVELIKKLLDKGVAYESDDGVYFSVSKFPDYGKLSRVKERQLVVGASGRVSSDEYSKDSVYDFALWKKWKEEDGEVWWETPFGKGRPGWHIECSVMSTHYLDAPLDIHAGGEDLIFPHHENEIAQYEAATGKKFCNHWFHISHLLVNGEKMSKSLGNFYTLKDLVERGFSPRSIRYVLLSTHYRKPLDFTFKKVRQADVSLRKLDEFTARMWRAEREGGEGGSEELVDKFKSEFDDALADDLNISSALGTVFELVNAVSSMKPVPKGVARKSLEFMKYADEVLGVVRFPRELSDEEMKMVQEREKARREKDFETADKIRSELASKGIYLIDTPEGTVWVVE